MIVDDTYVIRKLIILRKELTVLEESRIITPNTVFYTEQNSTLSVSSEQVTDWIEEMEMTDKYRILNKKDIMIQANILWKHVKNIERKFKGKNIIFK